MKYEILHTAAPPLPQLSRIREIHLTEPEKYTKENQRNASNIIREIHLTESEKYILQNYSTNPAGS